VASRDIRPAIVILIASPTKKPPIRRLLVSSSYFHTQRRLSPSAGILMQKWGSVIGGAIADYQILVELT
jgi:hypothetical protein